jgi:hypothetical protein
MDYISWKGAVKMFAQLSSYKGDRIVVELANGKQLAGAVIEVDQSYLRLETAEGICVVLISAIQVIWEKTGDSSAEEIAYQSMAVQDKKIQPDPEQMCTLMHARPCTMAFSQPCTQAYAQPCYQMFGQQPCYQMFGHPCPQAFAPQPYEDPCYHRFGHFGRPCYGLFGGFPFPHPYPYPPYPYPPYPYPPYPYPYNEQADEAAQQTQVKTEIDKEAQK